MDVQPSDHRSLALWAAECAEHVLPYFEHRSPRDERPRRAIDAARAWVRGEVTMTSARTAALAAQAAAREAPEHSAAQAAARAAGHAAATVHGPSHAAQAAAFALRATEASASGHDVAAQAAAEERAWQLRRLPARLRPLAVAATRRSTARPTSSVASPP